MLVPSVSSTLGTSGPHLRSLSASLQSRPTWTTLLPAHPLDLFNSSPTAKQPALPPGDTGEPSRDVHQQWWDLAKDLAPSQKLALLPCAAPLQEMSPTAQWWQAAFPRSFWKDTVILRNGKNVADLKNGCVRSEGEQGPCFKTYGWQGKSSSAFSVFLFLLSEEMHAAPPSRITGPKCLAHPVETLFMASDVTHQSQKSSLTLWWS